MKSKSEIIDAMYTKHNVRFDEDMTQECLEEMMSTYALEVVNEIEQNLNKYFVGDPYGTGEVELGSYPDNKWQELKNKINE